MRSDYVTWPGERRSLSPRTLCGLRGVFSFWSPVGAAGAACHLSGAVRVTLGTAPLWGHQAVLPAVSWAGLALPVPGLRAPVRC